MYHLSKRPRLVRCIIANSAIVDGIGLAPIPTDMKSIHESLNLQLYAQLDYVLHL